MKSWRSERTVKVIEPLTKDIERSVRSFVARGSELHTRQVIPANDGRSALLGFYATVLMISPSVQGIPESHRSLSSVPGEIDVLTTGSIRARYSVQWFREGAMDAARRFSIWTSSPEGLEAAAELGIATLLVSEVRRVDDIITLEFEERASLDLDIGYRERVTTSVNKLEGADIIVSNETHTQRLEIRDAIAA